MNENIFKKRKIYRQNCWFSYLVFSYFSLFIVITTILLIFEFNLLFLSNSISVLELFCLSCLFISYFNLPTRFFSLTLSLFLFSPSYCSSLISHSACSHLPIFNFYFFLSFFLPSFLPTFLHPFIRSFLPSYLPSSIHSFLPFFLPSFLVSTPCHLIILYYTVV